MWQTFKAWIEAIFKSEGAWRTWAIVAASLVLLVVLLWFVQVVVDFDVAGIVQGWLQ